jgi:hypothetical protein
MRLGVLFYPFRRTHIFLLFFQNCMGSWQPTAPGVQAQEVLVEGAQGADTEEPFCWGGTSMYMDGFQWLGSTCVIYLFPNWILNSAGKLVAACLGSVVFGAFMEYIIRMRRDVVQTMAPGWKRLGASAIFYGVQLSMGYSLMLVIMIYSVPLFLSVVVGLMGGHVLFNAKDALVPASATKRKETRKIDDSITRGATNEISEAFCCEPSDDGVPEGSTPCCQHTL